ncbi:MAG: ureidoglycolate lyase [Rhodocyclales bacterium]|nr:ureidoglycolate lyase [Rhodocyclales bacterium]
MNPPRIAEHLDAAAFAPYGDVIEVRAGVRQFTINAGSTERYHDLARIAPGPDGHAIVSIFRAQPRELPFQLQLMERHPLASQAFMQLSGHPYLVVVAPPGPAPKPSDLRIFHARPDQGVNYAPGAWHHPLIALDAVSDFLVIDRSGPGHNCDEAPLQEPFLIDIRR